MLRFVWTFILLFEFIKPLKRIIFKETKREMREVEDKLLRAREESSAYTEHESPEGKKYYFNTKLNQSTWDKPKCLSDLSGN
jgi:hypothetical protein